MKISTTLAITLFTALSLPCLMGVPVAVAGDVAPAPNGIELPGNYRDWRVIASSSRIDNNTLRVILGNDIAMEAARTGNTNPWPDGAILGKMVWKDTTLKTWEKAIVPGEFVHAEFMFKDADKWKDTGGWGFARWKGMDQTPYGTDAHFVTECFSCHTPVKDNDYVFTHPAILP
jgi:hypothetical protein